MKGWTSKIRKGSKHTDESRKGISENHTDVKGKNHPLYGKHHSEMAKQKMREAYKNLPEETKEKMRLGNKGKKHSLEAKLRMSEARRGRKFSEEHKQKMRESKLGSKNILWKGGISFEPYCQKFNERFKERVRNFFDRKCYVCGKTEEINGQKLSVHHVNYDKMTCCNDTKLLFVPLCKECHSKTIWNREEWKEFFIISLEYLTGGRCF